MRLTSERGHDGVTVVYAINDDGTEVAIADFWLTPLVDGWKVSREIAESYQAQFAMLLVTSHNRLFTPPLTKAEVKALKGATDFR